LAGWRVDGRRKPEVGTKAEPGTSRRRKLQAGSKAGLEGWRKARAGSWPESAARRLTGGASCKVGSKAKPKDAATDESEVRFEGRAGGSAEGASWKPEGKRSRTNGQRARALKPDGRQAGGTARGASRRRDRKARLRADAETRVEGSARRLSGKAG